LKIFYFDELSQNQLTNKYYAEPRWYRLIIPVNERIIEDLILQDISLKRLTDRPLSLSI
jgi:hypothetical protein